MKIEKTLNTTTDEMLKTFRDSEHKITVDELYHELCELIRDIYYVNLESKFPEKYKVTVAEEFLLRGEIESKKFS